MIKIKFKHMTKLKLQRKNMKNILQVDHRLKLELQSRLKSSHDRLQQVKPVFPKAWPYGTWQAGRSLPWQLASIQCVHFSYLPLSHFSLFSILLISMLFPCFLFPIHHSFLFISSEFPPLSSLLNHLCFSFSSSSNPSIPLSFKVITNHYAFIALL